jgi:hypothetical protein
LAKRQDPRVFLSLCWSDDLFQLVTSFGPGHGRQKEVTRQGRLLLLVWCDPQSVFVVVILDGTFPLWSSGLSNQVVSTGLSTKMLKGISRKKPSSFFVLRPGLSIPWVTKRSGLHRVP